MAERDDQVHGPGNPDGRTAAEKPSYRTPRLTKYGKLQDIAMATKGGKRSDSDPPIGSTKR